MRWDFSSWTPKNSRYGHWKREVLKKSSQAISKTYCCFFKELQVIIQEIRRWEATSYEQYLQSLTEMYDIYMQAEGHVIMYTWLCEYIKIYYDIIKSPECLDGIPYLISHLFRHNFQYDEHIMIFTCSFFAFKDQLAWFLQKIWATSVFQVWRTDHVIGKYSKPFLIQSARIHVTGGGWILSRCHDGSTASGRIRDKFFRRTSGDHHWEG